MPVTFHFLIRPPQHAPKRVHTHTHNGTHGTDKQLYKSTYKHGSCVLNYVFLRGIIDSTSISLDMHTMLFKIVYIYVYTLQNNRDAWAVKY